MTLKDRYYEFMDWWDKFKVNPWKTHGTVAFLGMLVGVYLGAKL